ncbi:MAG: HEAT repeat domain-containing protein [Chloroflexota bacterium]
MKVDEYRQVLRRTRDWDAFLLRHSGLPGPRGNLELAQAVAEEGDRALFARYAALGPDEAPVNTPQAFLAFCGVLGFGKLLCQGAEDALPRLRRWANDPRWRVREAVAMALQRYGDSDLQGMLRAVKSWSRGTPLEQRAAVAALCEPRLLVSRVHVQRVLRLLDRVTRSVSQSQDRRSDDFKALRQGLGYAWSVAVAALPAEGKAAMEKWFDSQDDDVRWIMNENLKKSRLTRMDSVWVAKWRRRLSA